MNEDSEFITKKYFKEEFDKFKAEIKAEIDFAINKYTGAISEVFRDRFQTFFQAYTDIPKLTYTLHDKAEENDYEHTNFRMRLGVLERSQKKSKGDPKQK